VIPYIVKDSFIKDIKFAAPESFTLKVEVIAICINYSVSWQSNGKQVTNDTNHLITTTSVGSSRYIVSLTVMESSESNSGIYSVMVASRHGNDSVNISVEVISKYKCNSFSVVCFIYISCCEYSCIFEGIYWFSDNSFCTLIINIPLHHVI